MFLSHKKSYFSILISQVLTVFGLFVATASQAQRLSFFDQETQQAPVLLADPEQAAIRSTFHYHFQGMSNEKGFWDLGFGGEVPFLLVKNKAGDQSLAIGVRGNVQSRFELFSASFKLYDADYYGGVSVYKRLPKLGALELFVYHKSSHLGDELYEEQGSKINFSREVLRLLWHGKLNEHWKLAVGPHFILRKDPVQPKGFLVGQVDLSYRKPMGKRVLFAGMDLKVREELIESPDLNIQVGYELTKSENDTPFMGVRQALVLEYFQGHSRMGQFFTSKERYLSVGILAWL